MSPVRADLKFSYAEYRSLPETGPRYQLVEGELLMSPAPNLRHQMIAANLFMAVNGFVRSKELGKVLFAPIDVILSDVDVLQPDIVYVSEARRSIFVPEGLRGGPDLCVEVLSTGTKELDRGPKLLLYARHRVTEYWIVDPDADTVEVYRLQENPSAPARRFGPADALTTPLLPGFALQVSSVFQS